ncbi:hypothetical protein QN355_06385 [Cryobacterium sp. 10S3]|uniref:hypothetical protein n=1 Tax=Cryobacterium sp. 10S3 TaxID=3048582 RepID=UPI002AC9EC6D|nr:hypothetical protein [Cryobacterium sp. 10S3]MEB0286176.1 hypothetical protein [Cryobacterium sp. 10S3]WPX12234.1 hypothetical protein RHM57_11125 [Cryobacterium sp. 10S3]
MPAPRLGQPLVYPARADGEQQRDAVLLAGASEETASPTIAYRARAADLARGRTGKNLGGPVRFDYMKPEPAAACYFGGRAR